MSASGRSEESLWFESVAKRQFERNGEESAHRGLSDCRSRIAHSHHSAHVTARASRAEGQTVVALRICTRRTCAISNFAADCRRDKMRKPGTLKNQEREYQSGQRSRGHRAAQALRRLRGESQPIRVLCHRSNRSRCSLQFSGLTKGLSSRELSTFSPVLESGAPSSDCGSSSFRVQRVVPEPPSSQRDYGQGSL